MAYLIVIATHDDILIVPGLFFEHFAFCNLQSASYLLYHLLVFST